MWRVCLISATFPPTVCGVGDYTFQLARALNAQGVAVSVLTSQQPSPRQVDGVMERIDVKASVPRWTVRALLAVLREIRAGGYDLVHLQYTPHLYGRQGLAVALLPWWMAAVAGCRTFVTFHEMYTPYLPGLRNRLVGTYHRLNDTLLLLGSTAAILTVPNRMTRLARLFPWLRERLHVIPVGSGLDVVPMTDAEREAQRARLGVSSGEVVLGSFGALHTDKRYEAFFAAVRRLLDRGYPVRGLVIGAYQDGQPYWERLKKDIADLALEPYIIWIGFGTPSEVSRWLTAVDLYVMTDVRGASGRKSSLVTALAHGLPIVSTRGADTTPEFIDGENIVLVDVEDDEGLVAQLSRLIRTPEERARLRDGARGLYASHYSWERIAQQTVGVYQTYASGAQR